MKKKVEKLPFRKIRAINDPEVIKFIKKTLDKKTKLYNVLNDEKIHEKFLKAYFKWIKSSKLNDLRNLNKFSFCCFSNGSSQVFDFFYSKFKDRNFRMLKGDYAYHAISWRNHFPSWSFVNNYNLKKNDALVISLPFSDTGSKHPEMEKLIKICNKKNIPVLVDCCYFAMCKGIDFNFDNKCIKAISFSLSKAFPVSRLRIGMRLTKEDDDDPFIFCKQIRINQ